MTSPASCAPTGRWNQKRWVTRRSPTASQLPLLGSNQDSPDPVPLRLSPPFDSLSVRGLDCAFTFAVTRSGGSRPVSTPSPCGAWLGVASQGFADFESIHARRFRRGVQRAHCRVPLESGVLPVTPRGSVPCLRPLASRPGRGPFYPEPRSWSIETTNPVCREPLPL